MEGVHQLLNGFINSLTVVNLFACFIGAVVGTVVGVLPGLGPTVTMALMLPFTMKFGPATGLIMMTGIWYGAMYGGSTTSILVNIPGEAASVVTCFDGYQMAKKGRAGAALALVAVGSFVAGTLGIMGLQLFAPLLGNAALSFGPPEYLAFMILAFVLLSNLSGDAPVKGAIMIFLGLFISAIGINPMDSFPRFTLGWDELMMGVDFLPIAMGVFGVSEILNIAVDRYNAPEDQQGPSARPVPDGKRDQALALPGLAGVRSGVFHRTPAGPLYRHLHFRRLFRGEEDFPHPGGIRKGRRRRRGGAGGGQQQRRHGSDDPPTDAGDPLRRPKRGHAGRPADA